MVTAAAAAALHGLDKDETRRKMGALLERIDSLAQVGHAFVLEPSHISRVSVHPRIHQHNQLELEG